MSIFYRKIYLKERWYKRDSAVYKWPTVKYLTEKKIGELTEFIINKFSDEGLSHDESLIILDKEKNVIGEYCIVQSLERRKS